MRQLTRKEAIAFFDGKCWEGWTHAKITHFQMGQDKLCIPFAIFHEAIEKTLGRPVYTHELGLARKRLLAELGGEVEAPTIDEILGLLPAEKLVVVVTP